MQVAAAGTMQVFIPGYMFPQCVDNRNLSEVVRDWELSQRWERSECEMQVVEP